MITLQTLDKRINSLDLTVGSLDKRVGSLEKKFDTLENRVETGFADMRATITNSINDAIDGLAIMLKQNFDHIEERFKKVDKRFEQIDNRFDQIDDRFDRIENVSIGGHERRIENLEDDMRSIKTKIGVSKK